MLTRRKVLLTRRKFLWGGLVGAVGVAADMRLIEPRWIRKSVVNVAMSASPLSRSLRILHLSDMHASKVVPVGFIRKAFELGIAQKPDCICITGDLISQTIPERDAYVSALRLLSEACPCVACVGNHDGGDWVSPHGGYDDLSEMKRLLKDAEIPLLFNASTTITIDGVVVELVGLGDYWAGDTKPEAAFAMAAQEQPDYRIVLSHNPDSKGLLAAYEWDLMLCGHTHGGQLSLPFLGTPFAPVHDQRYVYGLNEWKGRFIHTTSGVGNLHGVRFNCRPEVAVVTVS
jgi:predicted MPP superfamily phosphohydrolase